MAQPHCRLGGMCHPPGGGARRDGGSSCRGGQPGGYWKGAGFSGRALQRAEKDGTEVSEGWLGLMWPSASPQRRGEAAEEGLVIQEQLHSPPPQSQQQSCCTTTPSPCQQLGLTDTAQGLGFLGGTDTVGEAPQDAPPPLPPAAGRRGLGLAVELAPCRCHPAPAAQHTAEW